MLQYNKEFLYYLIICLFLVFNTSKTKAQSVFFSTKFEYSPELFPITFVLPTSGIKVHKNGWFYYGSDIGHYTVDGKEYYISIIPQLNIRSKEENIYERLQTALEHLATFCPKKKEMF